MKSKQRCRLKKRNRILGMERRLNGKQVKWQEVKFSKWYSQWSLRLLANQAVELGCLEHISHNQVGKILKKNRIAVSQEGDVMPG